MTPPGRWIRLDVGWDTSEWLMFLGPAEQLAWIKLLCWVKTRGVSGACKALSPKAAGKVWGIAPSDVTAMLEAAREAGAVECDGEEWRIAKWDEYQKPDTGAKDRMRAYRERQEALRRNGA
jgi:hypothetical protein